MIRPKRPSRRSTLAFAAFAAVSFRAAETALAQPDQPPPAFPQTDLPTGRAFEPNAHARDRDSAEDPLRRARDALMAAGDHGAALEPAERLVERPGAAADEQHGADLTRLGVINAVLGDIDAAERRYFEAIDVIRASSGEFSAVLIEPYHALGRSYIRERRFVEAIAALDQAQHVVQRNLGLFDVAQSELIDDLTTAYLGLGDAAAAERLQRERLDNAIRRFGENDPRVVPFRYGLAEYYEQSRLRGAAREQYEKALAALQAAPEHDDAALLETLRRLMRIEILLADRDDARAEIADILSRRSDLDHVERARSLVALGDFAHARDKSFDTARQYYREAYAVLGDASDQRDALFDRPEILDFIPPLTSVDRRERSRPYAWGTIVLEFDVSADGRAEGVSIVSAEPAGLVDAAYVRRIRETRLRPRIVDGEPVATSGVRYTHYFRHYVDR